MNYEIRIGDIYHKKVYVHANQIAYDDYLFVTDILIYPDTKRIRHICVQETVVRPDNSKSVRQTTILSERHIDAFELISSINKTS